MNAMVGKLNQIRVLSKDEMKLITGGNYEASDDEVQDAHDVYQDAVDHAWDQFDVGMSDEDIEENLYPILNAWEDTMTDEDGYLYEDWFDRFDDMITDVEDNGFFDFSL